MFISLFLLQKQVPQIFFWLSQLKILNPRSKTPFSLLFKWTTPFIPSLGHPKKIVTTKRTLFFSTNPENVTWSRSNLQWHRHPKRTRTPIQRTRRSQSSKTKNSSNNTFCTQNSNPIAKLKSGLLSFKQLNWLAMIRVISTGGLVQLKILALSSSLFFTSTLSLNSLSHLLLITHQKNPQFMTPKIS